MFCNNGGLFHYFFKPSRAFLVLKSKHFFKKEKMMDSDEDLIERYRNGDENAFTVLKTKSLKNGIEKHGSSNSLANETY